MYDDNEIKKANRKALPKFFLIMLLSMIVGGTIGFCSARFSLNSLSGSLQQAGELFGTQIAPLLLLLIAVLQPIICIPIYKNAKNLLATWDGYDEEISDTVEKKLSIVLWITGSALIISYFLIAAAYSGGFEIFENDNSSVFVLFWVSIVAFISIMIEATLLQQKCVDAAKKTNPEKTVSIYDTKFQKKWIESCDEAEKIMIGQCAFKAYGATNTVCTILAIVLALAALIFGIGFLPSLVVCIIWLVNQFVYCKESIKLSQAGNKIF